MMYTPLQAQYTLAHNNIIITVYVSRLVGTCEQCAIV